LPISRAFATAASLSTGVKALAKSHHRRQIGSHGSGSKAGLLDRQPGGSPTRYDAACGSGVLRAESVQELFDYSTVFAYQPLLKGNRIAIVTNAGGPGVMATDALERYGLVLAQMQPETEAALKEALPPAANNP
jgi:acetyltransferase